MAGLFRAAAHSTEVPTFQRNSRVHCPVVALSRLRLTNSSCDAWADRGDHRQERAQPGDASAEDHDQSSSLQYPKRAPRLGSGSRYPTRRHPGSEPDLRWNFGGVCVHDETGANGTEGRCGSDPTGSLSSGDAVARTWAGGAASDEDGFLMPLPSPTDRALDGRKSLLDEHSAAGAADLCSSAATKPSHRLLERLRI